MFEIHHRVNIPKMPGEKNPPLNLQTFLGGIEEKSVQVGGLFFFEKPNAWAYRSNAFTNGEQLLFAQEEQNKIKLFLEINNIPHFRVETCIERILGIWHS